MCSEDESEAVLNGRPDVSVSAADGLVYVPISSSDSILQTG